MTKSSKMRTAPTKRRSTLCMARTDSRLDALHGYVAMPIKYNGATQYAVVAVDGTVTAIRRTMNAALRDASDRNAIRRLEHVTIRQ